MAVLVVLAGGVAAGAAWWRWDTARRPQVRDVVAAMTRAVADAVTAAGPSVVVAVSGVVRSTDCEINAVRRGGLFSANADLYTRPGEEEDVVTAMAQALSRSYEVRRGVAASGFRPLEADPAARSALTGLAGLGGPAQRRRTSDPQVLEQVREIEVVLVNRADGRERRLK